MKTTEDIELVPVCRVIEELAEFEEEYSDYDMVVWTPDRKPCFPTSMELDVDGDLCIRLKQDDGDNYDVGTLLEELSEYDDDTRMYIAARGLYMNIEEKNDSTIFEEDCDEVSDIDVIACNGIVFGEYEDDWSDDDDDE